MIDTGFLSLFCFLTSAVKVFCKRSKIAYHARAVSLLDYFYPGWSDKNCTTFDFCSNNTKSCKNGATCQSAKSDFICKCHGNYTGLCYENKIV